MTFKEAELISNNSRQLGEVKTISDILDEFNQFQNIQGFMDKLNLQTHFRLFWEVYPIYKIQDIMRKFSRIKTFKTFWVR